MNATRANGMHDNKMILLPVYDARERRSASQRLDAYARREGTKSDRFCRLADAEQRHALP